MIVDNETDFSNAIIDDEAFVEYLKKNTQKVTAHIKSKEELRRIFKERGFDEKRIDFLLSLSKRPWRVPGEPLTSDVLESWIRLFEQQLANWYNESVTTQKEMKTLHSLWKVFPNRELLVDLEFLEYPAQTCLQLCKYMSIGLDMFPRRFWRI